MDPTTLKTKRQASVILALACAIAFIPGCLNHISKWQVEDPKWKIALKCFVFLVFGVGLVSEIRGWGHKCEVGYKNS